MPDQTQNISAETEKVETNVADTGEINRANESGEVKDVARTAEPSHTNVERAELEGVDDDPKPFGERSQMGLWFSWGIALWLVFCGLLSIAAIGPLVAISEVSQSTTGSEVPKTATNGVTPTQTSLNSQTSVAPNQVTSSDVGIDGQSLSLQSSVQTSVSQEKGAKNATLDTSAQSRSLRSFSILGCTIKTMKSNLELLLFAIFLSGCLGGTLHGLSSLTTYMGERRLSRSWAMWYLTKPVIGGCVGFAFCFIVMVGLIKGSDTDTSKLVNSKSLCAAAMLAGLASEAALNKMKAVFDSFFGATTGSKDESLSKKSQEFSKQQAKNKA